MINPTPHDIRQHGSAGTASGEVPGPLSVEGTRASILRSRATSEGEARLAAAIDGATPDRSRQAQEDAFSLPPRATSVAPAEKI